MGKGQHELVGKKVAVKYSGGEIRGVCLSVDVYLNVAVETEAHIHIIKGNQIEEMYGVEERE